LPDKLVVTDVTTISCTVDICWEHTGSRAPSNPAHFPNQEQDKEHYRERVQPIVHGRNSDNYQMRVGIVAEPFMRTGLVHGVFHKRNYNRFSTACFAGRQIAEGNDDEVEGGWRSLSDRIARHCKIFWQRSGLVPKYLPIFWL